APARPKNRIVRFHGGFGADVERIARDRYPDFRDSGGRSQSRGRVHSPDWTRVARRKDAGVAMNVPAIIALVRNDLRIFRTDRRAVIIGILVPILIAAFFGYVFGGPGDAETGKIPVIIVDEDQSAVSKAIADDLQKDSLLA